MAPAAAAAFPLIHGAFSTNGRRDRERQGPRGATDRRLNSAQMHLVAGSGRQETRVWDTNRDVATRRRRKRRKRGRILASRRRGSGGGRIRGWHKQAREPIDGEEAVQTLWIDRLHLIHKEDNVIEK